MYGPVAVAVAALCLVAYAAGRRKAYALAGGHPRSLHSRPVYYGAACALYAGMAGFGILILGTAGFEFILNRELESAARAALGEVSRIEIQRAVLQAIEWVETGGAATPGQEGIAERYQSLIAGRRVLAAVILLAAGAAGLFAWRRITPKWRARDRVETLVRAVLWLSAAAALLATIGIVFALAGETFRFFSQVPAAAFLFGLDWSPLAGVFAGVHDPERVGAVPLFAGTAMITGIAMLVAGPIGLMAAVYLSEFADPRVRAWAKPMLEILAGVPTVVYGFFAALTVAPFLRDAGGVIGLEVASDSALAAGLVMGIMIIPSISSLSDDVIHAVPQSLRDGALALGATRAETVRQVLLPAALPGIASAFLLGVSRAVGETMIVVMAAGQGANLTANPFEAVTTVTVQIVSLIAGDTEAETASGPAFALGFTLFCATLALNIWALRIVRRYREQYE